MTTLVIVLMISFVVMAIFAYAACTEVERLQIENRRLKSWNNGQRVAIEQLQTELWFKEDFTKEGA